MYSSLIHKRKDPLRMSMLYRKPHILALLLLVLFVVAITIFVILCFVTRTNSWHVIGT